MVLWLAAVVNSACAEPESELRAGPGDPAGTERASSLEDEVAEYLRRFPHQVTYDLTVRYTGGDPAKLNQWVWAQPALVKAGEDLVPHTNNDTFYKAAALLLDGSPVVLESQVAAEDRFSSLQLIDDRSVNYRNIVSPRGKYTLHFGEKPDRIEGEAIEVPSRLSVVIARVEVKNPQDPEDVAAATAVFDGLKIHGNPPAQFPRLDWLSGRKSRPKPIDAWTT
ncbi:MAG TPA: DUF1254 domain-containing protein [Gammaproteobacteria bacterium]